MKLKKVFGSIVKTGILIAGIGSIGYIGNKNIKKEKELKERYASYYQLVSQMLNNKNEGKEISKYLNEKNIHTVAIYGMGSMGELLYKELKSSTIKVKYFIDKNAEDLYYDVDNVPVMNIEEALKQDIVDVAIITPVFDFEEIRAALEDAGYKAEVLSLEDIIFEF